MATEKEYEKAYEILCKRANGALKLQYNVRYDGWHVVFENKWNSSINLFWWQNGQTISFIFIKKNNYMKLFDEVCISKTLLQYANDYDIVIGLFDPQVLLHKGETLESLLIESDLEDIA